MILKIKVKPNSSKQEVIEVENRDYVVSLKERAEDGGANLELIKLLKKYFKNKGRFNNIKIIKGLKSRNKVVEVEK